MPPALDRKMVFLYYGSATFYKGGDGAPRFFLIIISPEEAANQTELAFIEGMTYGLDVSYDAGGFKGNSQLALYSFLVENNNEEFAVQALPILTESIAVPIGFVAGTPSIYSFNAESLLSAFDYHANPVASFYFLKSK